MVEKKLIGPNPSCQGVELNEGFAIREAFRPLRSPSFRTPNRAYSRCCHGGTMMNARKLPAIKRLGAIHFRVHPPAAFAPPPPRRAGCVWSPPDVSRAAASRLRRRARVLRLGWPD